MQRILTILLAWVLAAVCGACERATLPGGPSNISRTLAAGRAYAAMLIARSRAEAELDREEVLALGYLERLRLGLGSPFRLMEHALRDPRLPDSVRIQVGRALLARTLDRDAYVVDPAALDWVGMSAPGSPAGSGRYHLELIEEAITRARDPRAGELAVRLAYALAAAEASVASRAPWYVARVAALVRDREVAREDVLRLVRAAQQRGVDPLDLLPEWRASRQFAVERPVMERLPLELEREAVSLALLLVEGIRSLELQFTSVAGRSASAAGEPAEAAPSGPTATDGVAPDEGVKSATPAFEDVGWGPDGAGLPPAGAASDGVPRARGWTGAFAVQSAAQRRLPLLGSRAARRLAELADSMNAPPRTPIVLAVNVFRPALLEAPRVSPAVRDARRRFADRATNEERFAAELALLHGSTPASAPAAAPALIALWAAVDLRPFGQEAVWFPGFPGPSARELEERYRLGGVRFDPEVPAAWRPYYRRMLDDALGALVQLLPSLDLRGLRIEFTERRAREGVLAYHDPVTRTLYLPPTTGAGTIAHEIAHDLDWQVALRRYRVRGDYGTDRATRLRGDRLAASVRGLSTDSVYPPERGNPARPMHAHRPAEVFARSMDWFVAAALARDGRTNGYLSSVQDDVLTGYGTVMPPDVTGGRGAALITILDEVAPVHPETRRWFLESHGPRRVPTAYDLVRRVLEPEVIAGDAPVQPVDAAPPEPEADAAPPPVWLPALNALHRARDAALAEIDVWSCRDLRSTYDPRLDADRRRLVAAAAEARARGLVIQHAREVAGELGRRWVTSRFYGPPWFAPALDSVLATQLGAWTEQARRLGVADVAERSRGFDLPLTAESCALGLIPSAA